MNARYSEFLKHTFVIGDSELRKIYKILQDRIGDVEISTECADNIVRDFENIDELFAYENPESKEIRRLSLTARSDYSDGFSKSAHIDFFDSDRNGISLNCKGSEDTVSKLKEDILNIIAGTRLWYEAMYSEHIWTAFMGINGILFLSWLFLFLTSLFMNLKWGRFSDPDPATVETVDALRTVMHVCWILFLVFGFFYRKLRSRFFPPVVFAIGQGLSRFKHKEKVQWGVVIALIVSLAAGLIITILQVIFG